jgi:phage tail-like protein
MDANQTRLQLLLGQADWLNCREGDDEYVDGQLLTSATSRAFWDSKRNAVTLRPKLFRFVATPNDDPPQLGTPGNYSTSDRRGAARDRFGNWYYISADRQGILAFSAGCGDTSTFWTFADLQPDAPPTHGLFTAAVSPPLAPTPAALSGVAVTADHYLVVGTLDPGGLLVFDLHAGGKPRRFCWPAEVPFAPFDMAPRARDGVWILDRLNRRYWALDRHLLVIGRDQLEQTLVTGGLDAFQPAEGEQTHGTPRRTFPDGIGLDGGSPLEAADPVSIEALPGDNVVILDAAAPAGQLSLSIYHFEQRLADPVLVPALGGESSDEDNFPAAYDVTFLPQAVATDPSLLGELYLVAQQGNQSFGYDLRSAGNNLQLDASLSYYPMRLFTGMGLVAGTSQVYYDSNGRWVPLIEQNRPQYEEEAVILTLPFDGREPLCVWHRLLLDGSLPSGTALQVWSRCADRIDQVDLAEWRLEPNPYQRGDGSELPFTARPTSSDSGTFEILFQQARGRYLRLKLIITGDGRATPRLRALRIYYPRFSYLTHYLPAAYRADSDSASFLERFLANLEGTNTATEDKIAAVQVLFDVRSAPADALAWLAKWFGIALDPSWNEPRQRLLIRNVMNFFQWRGTVHGLQMALHLAFDDTVCASIFDSPDQPACSSGGTQADSFRIMEKFRLRQAPATAFGDPIDDTGPRRLNNTGQWTPDLGVAELRRRYRLWIGRDDWADFELGPGASAAESSARAAFAQRELGFVPSEISEDQQGWQDYLGREYPSIVDLNTRHGTHWGSFDQVQTPSDQPQNAAELMDWTDYVAGSVSVPYGVKRTLWQDFLARRYRSVNALNAKHGTQWQEFEIISYPVTLPTQLSQLSDWFQFESLVLPTLAAAHRFSVLLPFTGYTSADLDLRSQQLDLAGRLIELEKPAHTAFDVKFYWALFRVGGARLGIDTVLGLGGRDPGLLPDAVLGRTYLAETRLAAGYPFNVTERQIIGRDQLN